MKILCTHIYVCIISNICMYMVRYLIIVFNGPNSLINSHMAAPIVRLSSSVIFRYILFSSIFPFSFRRGGKVEKNVFFLLHLK